MGNLYKTGNLSHLEIEELKRENQALKMMLDETIKASKSSQNVEELDTDFLQKYKLMLHINEYSNYLTSMPFTDNLFQIIADKLRDITGTAITLVNLYNPKSSNLVVRGASLSSQDNNILEKQIGKKAIGMKFYLSEDAIASIKDVPYIETSSLRELSFNQLPSFLSKIIESTFSPDWIVGFILTENDNILGSLVFIGKKGSVRYSVSDLLGFKAVTKVAISRWLFEKKQLENDIKFKFMIDNSKDIIWMLDLNLNFTYISPSFCDLLGYSEKEAYELTLDKIISQEHLPSFIDLFKNALEMEKNGTSNINRIGTFEHDAIAKDGRIISFETICSFLRDEHLVPIGIIGASRDLTEEKLAQKEIIYKNSIINSLFMNLPFDFWVRDKDQKLLLINQESRKKWGYEVGSTPETANDIPDEIINVWTSNNDRVLKGEIIKEEILLDGRNIYQIISPIHDEKNDIIGFGGINIDITETKQAEAKVIESEAALKRNNELLNILLDNLHIGVFIVEAPSGKLLIANPEAKRLLGRGVLSDANKDNLSEVYQVHKPGSSDPYPLEQIPIIRGMYGENAYIDDMIVERPDGNETRLEVFSTSIRDENGQVWASLVSFQDITERKQAETKLKESEEYLRITLNSIGDGVISTDINGLVVQMNPVAEHLTGWKLSEAIGKPLKDVFYIINAQSREIVENPVVRVIKTGRIIGLANHTILLSRNGEEVQIADSAAPIRDNNGVIHGVVLVFVDVTKDYAVRKELQENRLRLERAELCAEFGHYEFNLLDATVASSIGARKIYGIDDEDLTIPETLDYVIEEDRERIKEIMRKSTESDTANTIVYRIKRANDSAIRVIHSTVEYDKSKNIIFGVIQDITERTEAQESLLLSEARYRQIVENITISIIIHQDDKIVYVNRQCLKLFAISDQSVFIGKNITEFIYEDDREKLYNLLENTNSIDKSNIDEQRTIVKRLIRYDGKIITAEASALMIDYQGKPAYMVWLNDITELNEAIKQLSESEKKFRSLAENTQDIIMRFDKHHRIKYMNSSGTYLLGLNPSSIANKRITDINFFDFEREKLFVDTLDNVLSSSQPNRVQFEVKINDNDLVLDCYFTPEINSDGNIISVITIARDITEINLIQTELEIARKKAEDSDKLKSLLLANLSQELRTPMNSIIGFANLLENNDISHNERLAYSNLINQSAHKLSELINNIIDISLIETGKIALNNMEFNVNNLLFELYEDYSSLSESKALSISVSYGLSDSESIIYSDAEKIKKVFMNLLSNAVKFTQQGRIEFGYTVVGKFIYFFVKDTGLGMTADQINFFFSKTGKSDYTLANEHSITGLGLHLCKGLVELLDGSFGIDPQKIAGTKFYFKIPYLKSESEDNIIKPVIPIADKPIVMQETKKILVAEDDNISFLLLKNILSKEGNYEIINAPNGNKAVELVKENPDLLFVFMDLKMPDLNGFDATRIIRSFMPNLPIIAITALATLGDREKVLESGCNDYISKPYNPKDVIQKMKRLLS